MRIIEQTLIINRGEKKEDREENNKEKINSMTKIDIDNKEIKYLIVNERGRVIETGEEFDTFQDTKVDLSSIKLGRRLRITFNNKVWTELNYKVINLTEYV